MYIEYNLQDLDLSENELKEKITKAIQLGVSAISVPFAYTKLARTLTKDTKVIISNNIDYPLGILDTHSRGCCVTNAINNGAQKINIVLQNYYLSTRKYDKIREDIAQNFTLCKECGIDLNYFLEYRIFTHQTLIKACGLLSEGGINNAFVSTGYFLDDPIDNVIAAVLLKEKTKVVPSFSGNLWNIKQVDNIKKNHIGIAIVNCLESVKLLSENQY